MGGIHKAVREFWDHETRNQKNWERMKPNSRRNQGTCHGLAILESWSEPLPELLRIETVEDALVGGLNFKWFLRFE